MRRRQPFSILPLVLLLALAFLQVGEAVGHGIGKGHLRSRRAPEDGNRTRDAKRQLLDLDLGLDPLLEDGTSPLLEERVMQTRLTIAVPLVSDLTAAVGPPTVMTVSEDPSISSTDPAAAASSTSASDSASSAIESTTEPPSSTVESSAAASTSAVGAEASSSEAPVSSAADTVPSSASAPAPTSTEEVSTAASTSQPESAAAVSSTATSDPAASSSSTSESTETPASSDVVAEETTSSSSSSVESTPEPSPSPSPASSPSSASTEAPAASSEAARVAAEEAAASSSSSAASAAEAEASSSSASKSQVYKFKSIFNSPFSPSFPSFPSLSNLSNFLKISSSFFNPISRAGSSSAISKRLVERQRRQGPNEERIDPNANLKIDLNNDYVSSSAAVEQPDDVAGEATDPAEKVADGDEAQPTGKPVSCHCCYDMTVLSDYEIRSCVHGSARSEPDVRVAARIVRCGRNFGKPAGWRAHRPGGRQWCRRRCDITTIHHERGRADR